MSRLRPVGVAVVLVAALSSCSGSAVHADLVRCDTHEGAYHVLVAQSVPSASLLPCVRLYPVGWRFGGSEVRSGVARFWLDSDRAGIHAVEVSLTPTCTVAGMTDVTDVSGELNVEAYFHRTSVTPFVADRSFVFRGGCVSYHYRFGEAEGAVLLAAEANDALTFADRSLLVAGVEDTLGVTLCGADAPPCVGEE